MKKRISLLLIICILCPILSGCAQKQNVSDELKIEIIEDYLSWSGLKGDLLAADVECTFLGKYGDSVAVYFNSAGAYDIETEETIKGITFTYPDSRVIRIWNNGKFYKIFDAYEQELIKRRHIKKIYNKSLSIVHGEPLFIWEEKVYCDYDEYRHPVYLTPDFNLSSYGLTVTIDANLSRPEKIFDSEFFESIGVAEIRDATEHYSKYTTIYPNDAYRQIYYIKLAYPSSKENMKRVVAILEAKEGIKMVRPREQGYGLSGTTISDSSDEPINWGLENINVEKVWDFTTGSSLLCIGILDSGIASHEALNSNYSIDDALDFYNTLSTTPTFNSPNDVHSHGTHIAGIIGGLGNNEMENFGVNLNVRLTQLRALYAEDTEQAIANAFNYATDKIIHNILPLF